MAGPMRTVDGAMGEGGGQVLRTSAALAVATGEPVEIVDVRAERSNPGLAAQHAAALRGLETLAGGTFEGVEVGSDRVVVDPGTPTSKTVRVDVGTAGSVTLILECLMLASLGADGPVRIEATGGTDVRWSPSWDLFAHVFLDHLDAMGLDPEARLERRGHYPEGGGRVTATVEAKTPTVPDLTPPKRRPRVEGVVHLTDLPDHIADRMRTEALEHLIETDNRIEIDRTDGSTGCGISLWTPERPRLGASALGEQGVPAEEIARDAVEDLQVELAIPVTTDVRTADQILPFLALADRPSRLTVRAVSGHLTTLARLLGQLDVADVEIASSEPATVQVEPR